MSPWIFKRSYSLLSWTGGWLGASYYISTSDILRVIIKGLLINGKLLATLRISFTFASVYRKVHSLRTTLSSARLNVRLQLAFLFCLWGRWAQALHPRVTRALTLLMRLSLSSAQWSFSKTLALRDLLIKSLSISQCSSKNVFKRLAAKVWTARKK